MSRERELLAYALDRLKHINFEDDHLTNDLIQTIQKHLAQPEPFKPDWDNYKQGVADSKREPLSEDKLDALAEANITDEGIAGYYLGFRDAEKAHGIGVDDE